MAPCYFGRDFTKNFITDCLTTFQDRQFHFINDREEVIFMWFDDDFFDDFDDWQDIGMAFALGEEISEEERVKRQLEKEMEEIDPPENSDDEDNIP